MPGAASSISIQTRTDRSALVLADDADLRETLIRIVSELSGFLVDAPLSLADARRAIEANAPSVLIVAPRWADDDVHALLRELDSTRADLAIVIIAASACDHRSALVVNAPFEVDELLTAIELGLANVRVSRSRMLSATRV